ncbi:MAG: hypothetical protein V3U96_02440 [Paracoccaceae bacterium]
MIKSMGIYQVSERPLRIAILHTATRVFIVVAIAIAVHFLIGWVELRAAVLAPRSQGLVLGGVLLIVVLVYAILIAIPFVPGIEIGVSLMMIRGAEIAPVVYLATVVGLVAAFLAGRFVSYDWLHRVLLDLRLKRACGFLETIKNLNRQQRLEMLHAALPAWLRPVAINFRYMTLAALINLPGNSFIGGGGGICMMAGLSRLFTPWGVILTIVLAVAPVPILVLWFGTGVLGPK